MNLTNKKIIIGLVIIILSLVFGYLFFERFLTEKQVTITVLDSSQFGDEPGRYLIFTKDEVFEDTNNYYHDKHNATEVYKKLQRGKTYVVRVVSFYWPDIPHFRNIIDVVEEKYTEVN